MKVSTRIYKNWNAFSLGNSLITRWLDSIRGCQESDTVVCLESIASRAIAFCH